MTSALEALATRLTALETDLAGAATAAEVEALQTALAAAQSDLTELLASNNVYSDNLTINSAATLAVAKNLGGKLAIINGNVTISQSSSLDAAELQEVLDVMVTVTGNISYTMTVNSSTQATFDNLTSVGDLTLDVAGDINFPVLENAGKVTLNTTHKNYVTSVEFPVLSKVTSFYTGSDADAIDFPKATAVTLTALANYVGVASDLTIGGKLNFTLDLAALTSKKSSGAKNAIDLIIKGAAEVDLPEFTEGSIVANTSAKVVLPKFEGSGSDSFTKATYLHLAAYEHGLKVGNEVSTSLDTLLFTGVVATGADNGPSLDLTGATGLSTLTVDGTINTLDLDGTTSLSEVSLSGKANAIIVTGASSLEELTLDHTAADAELASLSVTGNESLSTLTVSALVSAASLTITDNDALETLEFTALKTQGGKATTKASINISDNNLTASSIEYEVEATTDDKDGTGTIVTESGLDTLEAYIGAAATRYATTSGSIYVAFDTVELYTGTDGEPSTAPIEWSASSTPAETIIVDLKAATTTGDPAIARARSFTAPKGSTDITVATTATGVDAESLSTYNLFPQVAVGDVILTGDPFTDMKANLADPEAVAKFNTAGINLTVAKHWGTQETTSLELGLYEDASTTTATTLVEDDEVTINFMGKEHVITIPALTSTSTLYGVTVGASVSGTELNQIIVQVMNDMDNSKFVSTTYGSSTTLSSTFDLGKITASTATVTASGDAIKVTADNQNPMNGLVANLDITVDGEFFKVGNSYKDDEKIRVLEIDYDELLYTATAKVGGLDTDFTLTSGGTNDAAFVVGDYDGVDGKVYFATKEVKGAFDTYLIAQGLTPTYATKATAPAVNKENLDNYPKGLFQLPVDSTVEADEAAGTTNWSAWF